MKKWPIALQIYSIRHDAMQNFAAAMRQVKEMGYQGVELAGLYGMGSAVVCRQVLDEIGLALVSAHTGMDVLLDDAQLDDYAAAGIRYLAIPWRAAPASEAELAQAIAQIRHAAERCAARGIHLLYHNHDMEFAQLHGQYVLDSYYASIPASLLQTELDTCWVRVAGEDPAAYLRKYSGRAPVLHLKDFVGAKADHMYALIGSSAAREEHTGAFELRPVGYGKQDFPAILQAAAHAGTQWLVVEQDSPSLGRTPMECARMSIDYLKSLMNESDFPHLRKDGQ